MGLLDDAIREHLDLKRRRGGDPDAIAQAERDALGPVRREREPTPVDEVDGEFADDSLPPADPALPVSAPGNRIAADPALPISAPANRIAIDPEIDWDDPADHAVDAAPVAPSSETAGSLRDDRVPISAGQETVEYRLDEALPHELSDEEVAPEAEAPAHPGAVSRLRSRFSRQPSEPPSEPEQAAPHDPNDVLEETPDFLQDTPDHDRLWFEQKPPRDFKFDS